MAKLDPSLLEHWIVAAAADTGLPAELLRAQIRQESDFDPRAESSCGARGLLQIMPETARQCGVDPDSLWDPALNVRLGAAILRERVAVFKKEDRENALKYGLAAYNGGLGPVINAQALAAARGLDPSQWDDLRLVLPNVQVYYNGEWRQPDYRQIIGYVDTIWRNYERAAQPATEPATS